MKKYKKEKLSSYMKVTKLFLSEMGEDLLRAELTATLEAYLYQRMNDRYTKIVYAERPNFFDWLFRRKKAHTFDIELKEVLPYPDDDKLYYYEVNEISS